MAHILTNWPGFTPPPWPTVAPPLTGLAELRRHRHRLAVALRSDLRHPGGRPRLGLDLIPLRLADPGRDRDLCAGRRRGLAGDRHGHGHHAGRVEGHRPRHLERHPHRRRPSLEGLCPRHPRDDPADDRHSGRPFVADRHQGLRPGGRDYRGGPGISTEVPAKYVMDMLFQRNNLGQATAAATIMLLAICLLVGLPWALLRRAK